MKNNRICYQVPKPGMEFHIIDMKYAALPMHNILMQRQLGQILHVHWSGGKGLLKNQDRTRPELTQP